MRSTPLVLLTSVLPLCAFAQDTALSPSDTKIVEEKAVPEKGHASVEAPIPQDQDSAEHLSPNSEEVLTPREEQAATEIETPEKEEEEPVAENSEPAPKWYFTFQPGYFYFTDASMREFYNTGGFSMRGEAGCRVWGPLIVWMDGGYFQKDGTAIGGDERHKIMLGTITLGLKAIHYFHDSVAIYGGAGPRLFIAVIHNGSPYVSGVDTGVGIGGAFNGGIWVFPFFKCKNAARNIYLDFFADYSLKTLKIDEDEVSSEDYDVDVSGVTAGLGIGIRF